MDFLAIDIETPNKKNDSICSLGMTLVKHNEIVFNKNILINPHAVFDASNIGIHGITKGMVKDAPSLAEVWKEYNRYFRHYPIVAHSASFDASVLAKAAKRERFILPRMDFYCTKQLCQENYGMEKTGLECVCEKLGIELEHHNSGSDSLAAAKIMIALCGDEKTSIHTLMNVNDWEEKYTEWSEKVHNTIVHEEENEAEDEIEKPDCQYTQDGIVFEGKRFVLTGTFPGLERSKAAAFIEKMGGAVTGSVSKKTDYVIVGLEDKAVVGQDGKSGKIEKAEALIEQGFAIQIVECEKLIEAYKNS